MFAGEQILLAERSRAASGLHLSSVPSQAKLVQFSCVHEPLFSEPEVSSIWCRVCTCMMYYVCMYNIIVLVLL